MKKLLDRCSLEKLNKYKTFSLHYSELIMTYKRESAQVRRRRVHIMSCLESLGHDNNAVSRKHYTQIVYCFHHIDKMFMRKTNFTLRPYMFFIFFFFRF